jgi:hypothetical protein
MSVIPNRLHRQHFLLFVCLVLGRALPWSWLPKTSYLHLLCSREPGENSWEGCHQSWSCWKDSLLALQDPLYVEKCSHWKPWAVSQEVNVLREMLPWANVEGKPCPVGGIDQSEVWRWQLRTLVPRCFLLSEPQRVPSLHLTLTTHTLFVCLLDDFVGF